MGAFTQTADRPRPSGFTRPVTGVAAILERVARWTVEGWKTWVAATIEHELLRYSR